MGGSNTNIRLRVTRGIGLCHDILLRSVGNLVYLCLFSDGPKTGCINIVLQISL